MRAEVFLGVCLSERERSGFPCSVESPDYTKDIRVMWMTCVCVCVCVRACVRLCACVYVRACVKTIDE